MPWSNAQRREKYAQDKAAAEDKRKQMGNKLKCLAPPINALNRPYKKKDVGVSTVDYGGHQKALNFPFPEDFSTGEIKLAMATGDEVPQAESMHSKKKQNSVRDEVVNLVDRVGTLTIGLVYEGDWKRDSKIAGKGERVMCKKSEKYLSFLLQAKAMLLLHPLIHPTVKLNIDDILRLNVLFGALTLSHTDSFRGNTPNALYICSGPQQPGFLCYDRFPEFKSSMVRIPFGLAGHKYFIPHSYSAASDEVRCIGENPNKPGYPIFYIFPSNTIDIMEPVGRLGFAVVGWKSNGKIQVVDDSGECCIYRAPLTFNEYTWPQLLYFAQENGRLHPGQTAKPRKRIVTLSKTDTWMVFDAWRYRHWWVGNHMVVRYHAFFRSIRQTPTSSNIVRKGKRINYIKLKSPSQLSCLSFAPPTNEDFDEVNCDELEPNSVESLFDESDNFGWQTAII